MRPSTHAACMQCKQRTRLPARAAACTIQLEGSAIIEGEPGPRADSKSPSGAGIYVCWMAASTADSSRAIVAAACLGLHPVPCLSRRLYKYIHIRRLLERVCLQLSCRGPTRRCLHREEQQQRRSSHTVDKVRLADLRANRRCRSTYKTTRSNDAAAATHAASTGKC